MYSLILHGRRLIHLQKWRHLGVSLNTLHNAFSFSSAAEDGRLFTVSYLVDSLGFTTKRAQSLSKKVSFDDKVNPDSVLSLLRTHGFTDSQISTIITSYPKLLLVEDAERDLAPKLQFLQSRGDNEFTEIVCKVPKILGKRVGKGITRYYDFIKEIVEADKSSKYVKLCHSLAEGSVQANKIRNVSVLRELGVPQRLLFPLLISSFGSVCGKDKFEESLKKVVEMGFDPTTSKFVDALNVVYHMSTKAMEEKLDFYVKLGFGVGDVWKMFKKFPNSLRLSEKKILNAFETFLALGFTRDEIIVMVKGRPHGLGYSPETVKKKTEFVVKTMNWPLKRVAMFPQTLGYNMEKRIVPRCEVIKAVMSKGLIGSELPPLSSVLSISDQAFLNKYVMKHDDKLVLELMAIFTKNRVS